MTPELPKAARRGLSDEAADLVREAIFAGLFPPGAPLREVELATRLGISRGSVREGLATLDREGLLRTGWHRATTVIEVRADDVEEVYALRSALDELAATTARRVVDPAALAEIDALVDALESEVRAGADRRRLVALDIAFHDRIHVAAGNTRLTAAWRAIRSQVHLFHLRRVESGYRSYRTAVVPEHRQIAGLLRDGDPDRLADVVREHVDAARRALLADLPDSKGDR